MLGLCILEMGLFSREEEMFAQNYRATKGFSSSTPALLPQSRGEAMACSSSHEPILTGGTTRRSVRQLESAQRAQVHLRFAPESPRLTLETLHAYTMPRRQGSRWWHTVHC